MAAATAHLRVRHNTTAAEKLKECWSQIPADFALKFNTSRFRKISSLLKDS